MSRGIRSQSSGGRVIGFVEVSTGSGGVRCARCSGSAKPVSYRPASEISADVSAVCRGESAAPNIMVVGAEPFGHPELPGIVTGTIAAGCRRLGLHTDASALRSDQNAGGALAAGVRHLRVTLLAGSPGLHDALVNVPGALDAALAGVDTFRLRAAAMGLAVDIVAHVPVCRHNVHDVPAAVGVAVAHGFDRVVLVVSDAGLGIASSAPWVKAACDTGVVNGVWVEVEGMPYCAMKAYELHLSDVMRPRQGAKSRECAVCPVDHFCGGAASGTAGDSLSDLDASVPDCDLARALARARGTAVV